VWPNFCHRRGKSLPQAWQKFATGMAKVCHGQDKTLPRAGKSFGHGRKKFWPQEDNKLDVFLLLLE
jgi:hypothetical protein